MFALKLTEDGGDVKLKFFFRRDVLSPSEASLTVLRWIPEENATATFGEVGGDDEFADQVSLRCGDREDFLSSPFPVEKGKEYTMVVRTAGNAPERMGKLDFLADDDTFFIFYPEQTGFFSVGDQVRAFCTSHLVLDTTYVSESIAFERNNDEILYLCVVFEYDEGNHHHHLVATFDNGNRIFLLPNTPRLVMPIDATSVTLSLTFISQ
jgi:hypothetical protein